MHWLLNGVLTLFIFFVLLLIGKYNPHTTTHTIVVLTIVWFSLDGIQAQINRTYKWFKRNDTTTSHANEQ